jgi:hypothetical protein
LSSDGLTLTVFGEIETERHWNDYQSMLNKTVRFDYPRTFKRSKFHDFTIYEKKYRAGLLLVINNPTKYDPWLTKYNKDLLLRASEVSTFKNDFSQIIFLPNYPTILVNMKINFNNNFI